MKNFVWGFLVLSFIPSLAIATTKTASPFQITQDGVQYSCVAAATVTKEANKCAVRAFNSGFSRDEATQLCSGARDLSPADCANASYNMGYTRSQSVSICAGTLTVAPSECARRANTTGFSKDQAVTLCSQMGTKESVDCATNAYNAGFSRDQSVQLCR